MRNDTADGDGTLLPSTPPVKQNPWKSFRASKQPAPECAALHGLPLGKAAERTLQKICRQNAVKPANFLRAVAENFLSDTRTDSTLAPVLAQQTRQLRRPRHPVPPPSPFWPECLGGEPEPFTLVLIRSPRPDPATRQPEAYQPGETPVPPGPEHLVAVRLVEGEPFRLVLDGATIQESGESLGVDAPRSVLTIKGHATPGQRQWMRVRRYTTVVGPADETTACGILIVSASAAHPFDLVLDVGSATSPQRKGGQHHD